MACYQCSVRNVCEHQKQQISSVFKAGEGNRIRSSCCVAQLVALLLVAKKSRIVVSVLGLSAWSFHLISLSLLYSFLLPYPQNMLVKFPLTFHCLSDRKSEIRTLQGSHRQWMGCKFIIFLTAEEWNFFLLLPSGGVWSSADGTGCTKDACMVWQTTRWRCRKSDYLVLYWSAEVMQPFQSKKRWCIQIMLVEPINHARRFL